MKDQLIEILQNLQLVETETTIMIGAIVILIAGLIKQQASLTKILFLGTLVAGLYFHITLDQSGLALSNALSISSQSQSFGSLFILSAMLLVVFQRDKQHATEFYFFILAMLIGSLFMIKSNSLLIMYLAVELASFTSYILTNFIFKKQGFEAGIKYLLFGAICSAIMLFGIGFVYGSTGTLLMHEWTGNDFQTLVSQVGLVMVLIGVFFKISLFPTHIWVPATYQSAPNDATAFMSIVPKLAGLILLSLLLTNANITISHWVYKLVLLAGILTILVGTLGALRQQQVRRMVSFGAIAHSGFLLPLILNYSSSGQEAFWYYGAVYASMNLSLFFIIDAYERNGMYDLSDYTKAQSQYWLGVVFSLILVSLIGLPPLAGFTAKFFMFTTLWEGYQLTGDLNLIWYLIVALLATVASLFFYFQIPRKLFLSPQANTQSINLLLSTKIIATLFCIVLLLLFFVPQLVMDAQHMLNNIHE